MFKLNGILRLLAYLGVLLTFGSVTVFAQLGGIQGVVTDPTSAAVPGATVTITNTGTGIARQVKTDEQGRYTVTNLNIGTYDAQAEMQGFSTQTLNGLVVAVGQTLAVNFKLQVGTVSQQVTITGTGAPVVNTTTSEVGALVNQSQMQQLPLNGRNYNELFSLVPGVSPEQSAGGSGGGTLTGSDVKFNVAGTRADMGSVLLDGVEIRSMWGSGAGMQVLGTSLGIDGIAEFQTMTSSFNAQYNGLSVVNAVTRSGTNQIHGSAYGFFRNSGMNARNYFDPVTGPPAASYYQFGGAIGGPIKKDKAFYFVNYEGLKATITNYNNLYLPDANAHNGLLPCALAPDKACIGGFANVGVNPAVAPYLAFYPTPPAGATEVSGLGVESIEEHSSELQHENFVAAKIDYTLSSKDNLAFRYVIDTGAQHNPWAGGGNVNSPGNIDPVPYSESAPERNQYSTLEERRIFSPNLINVLTASFVRTRFGDAFNYTGPGSATADPLYTFLTGLPVLGAITIPNVATVEGATGNTPTLWAQNIPTFQDEVDWIHGGHSFKFGGTFSRTDCNCEQSENAGLEYQFGNGFESFLEAKPSLLEGPIPGTPSPIRGMSQTDLHVYVQDDWRVTKRLIINLGIRDDYATNPTEVHDLIYRVTNPLANASWTHEPRMYENNPSTKNIEPRVGFAWDVFGDQKTSLRGGFGFFDDVMYPRAYEPGLNLAYPYVIQDQTNPSFPNPIVGGFGTGTIVERTLSQPTWDQCCIPYTMEYNLTVERQLPGALAVSATYVGSGSVHLGVDSEYNTVTPTVTGLPASQGLQYRASPNGPFPNPAFSQLAEMPMRGNSHYNSGILVVKRTLGNGIQFQSGYTWSKCLDVRSSDLGSIGAGNDSTAWLYPDLVPKSYNYGPCAFNVKLNWTSNALIPLPFHGNQWKEGWQLALIYAYRTGAPLTPEINEADYDISNFGGVTGHTNTAWSNERTNLSTTPAAGPLMIKTASEWFNINDFTLPAPGYMGTLPRGYLTGPGYDDADLATMKSIKLPKWEAASVQLRGDLFNVFNHTNFGLPSGEIYTSATPTPPGAKISTTFGNSRQLQVSATLEF